MHRFGVVTPTEEEFLQLAGDYRVIPVSVRVLADSHSPLSIYRTLAAGDPGTFLMESAAPGAAWDRHSFIGVNSAATLSERDGRAHWIGQAPAGAPSEGTATEVLRETLNFLTGPHGRALSDQLPHLASGLVGYAGWDVVLSLIHI